MTVGLLSIAGGASATWQIMPMGPGGNILGLAFANDGTAVGRCDTSGAFVAQKGQKWAPLVNTSIGPSAIAQLLGSYAGGPGLIGCYSVTIAPSSSSIIYMLYQTSVYKSTDQGKSFAATGFTPITAPSVNSAADSSFNEKIAVDPQNANICIAGTPSSGAFLTINGGTSWTALSGLATPSNLTANGNTQGAGYTFAFDPSSAVTGGAQQGIYLSVYGTGVYHSTNGGTSWSLLNSSGMPTTIRNMSVSTDGALYVVDNSLGNNLNIWNGTSWSSVSVSPSSTNEGGIVAVAADPNTAARVVAIANNGAISESGNHGATWTDWTPTGPVQRTSADVPWVATTNHANLNCSHGAFDPSSSNKFYVADGLTVWWVNSSDIRSTTSNPIQGSGTLQFTLSPAPASLIVGSLVNFQETGNAANITFGNVASYNPGTGVLVANCTSNQGSGTHTDWSVRLAPSYQDQGAGIEQLIGTGICVPPGGSPNVSVWDRCGFLLSSKVSYPANQDFIGTSPNEICAGWDIDYAFGTPTFLAGIFNFPFPVNETSGKSTDGGQTWTKFSSTTPSGASDNLNGGAIAVSTTTNICWFPSTNGGTNLPYYTTDGGTTWNLCSFPAGVPTTGSTGWGSSYFGLLKLVCADRVNANTFYAFNTVTGDVYVSTNSGQTWTQANTGNVRPTNNSLANSGGIKSVPKLGSTSTAGWLLLYQIVSGQNDCLVRSTNAGVTWSVVDTNFTLVAAMGFGAPQGGNAVAAILVAGIYNGVRGLFQSIDNGATWTNITGGFNSPDQVFDIDGDKSTPGIWYLQTENSGTWRYGT